MAKYLHFYQFLMSSDPFIQWSTVLIIALISTLILLALMLFFGE